MYKLQSESMRYFDQIFAKLQSVDSVTKLIIGTN